jgi:hypothetical protein
MLVNQQKTVINTSDRMECLLNQIDNFYLPLAY